MTTRYWEPSMLIPWHPSPPAVAREPVAKEIMRGLNPFALAGREGDTMVFIEDHWDSPEDRRLYRLEYQSTLDGRGAIAICQFNPWGWPGNPAAGVPVTTGHMFQSGLLCLDAAHPSSPHASRLDLETVVLRARYWCTAFSVLMETGTFPHP